MLRRRRYYGFRQLTPKQKALKEKLRNASTWISILASGFSEELKRCYSGDEVKEFLLLANEHLLDAANREIEAQEKFEIAIKSHLGRKGKGAK